MRRTKIIGVLVLWTVVVIWLAPLAVLLLDFGSWLIFGHDVTNLQTNRVERVFGTILWTCGFFFVTAIAIEAVDDL